MPILQFQQLPAQQEQNNVMGLLNQQHQQQIQQIDGLFAGQQENIMSDVRYRLQTLSDKYQTERRYVEGLKIPADQKRQKLLQLNTKYELAAITAKSKIRPDMDNLNSQKNQMMQRLQAGHQAKLQELEVIERNGQEWSVDPQLIEARKMQAIGYTLPAAWFKQADPQQQLIGLAVAIGALEEQAATAKGEQRKNILLQLEKLQQERVKVMSRLVPGFEVPIKTATKLSGAALAAGMGRKPGTLAEGMLREKRKALKTTMKTTIPQFPAFAPIVKSEREEKSIEPKYQRNKTTGETRVSYDGGKTWQAIG
jgi:hypothetical protein